MSERDIRTILKDATACAVVTIDALEQKNAKLREALERYGRHNQGCFTRFVEEADREIQCDCGLDDLLAELVKENDDE